jgi:hypothetical protein
MKMATLAISALAAFALTAGVASAQMQPIPNPPETPHHHGPAHHHGHHHPAPKHHRHHHKGH